MNVFLKKSIILIKKNIMEIIIVIEENRNIIEFIIPQIIVLIN